MRTRILFLLIVGSLFVSCQATRPSKMSGFLSKEHYDELKRVETPGDQILFRYISPNFDPSSYDGVIVDKVISYPKPEPTERVSMDTLTTLQDQLTGLVEGAMSRVLELRKAPSPGTLRLQVAITGVDVSTEGLAPYEIIPIALISAGVMTLAGERDQSVTLYLETRLVDSVSGDVLIAGLRELSGDDLSNVKEQLDAKKLNKGLTEAGKQVVETVHKMFAR